MKLPLVLIEWEDSVQALPHWQWLSEIQPPKISICHSVGYLVQDGKREKSLAISCANPNDAESAQVSGIISIPTRCIIKIHKLTCPSFYLDAVSKKKRK